MCYFTQKLELLSNNLWIIVVPEVLSLHSLLCKSIFAKKVKLEKKKNRCSFSHENFMKIFFNMSRFNNWHASRTYVCLLLLEYTRFGVCLHWHAHPFPPYDLLKLSRFFWFFQFYTIWKRTAIYLAFNFFVFLKKTYFSIFHTNYFINISCQIMFSVRK